MGTERSYNSDVDTASGTRKGMATPCTSTTAVTIVLFRTNVTITGRVWSQLHTEKCPLLCSQKKKMKIGLFGNLS